MTNFVPARLFTYLLVFSIISLSSCKKGTDPDLQATYLRFINTSPTLGTYNIYVADKMVNTAALPFGGTVSYAQYYPGTQTIKVTTASDMQSLITKQVVLANSGAYSLYLIDKGDKMDALLVTDNMTTSSSTKASIRFINLTPDAPALNLDLAAGTNLVKDKTYKTESEYAAIDPKTYTFEIKDSATGVVKTTLTDIEIVAGRYYTIISRGMLNPATNDQPFSGQVIINQ
ncbi:MAG: DUF4397 domain-containing protein [Bacteroidota bacterium]